MGTTAPQGRATSSRPRRVGKSRGGEARPLWPPGAGSELRFVWPQACGFVSPAPAHWDLVTAEGLPPFPSRMYLSVPTEAQCGSWGQEGPELSRWVPCAFLIHAAKEVDVCPGSSNLSFSRKLPPETSHWELQAGFGQWTCFVWAIQFKHFVLNWLSTFKNWQISYNGPDFWLLLKNQKI